jgi:AraC family transcriptional regulator of adaptative response/methylated-DNA-[protein]-cysteine methyltransferase
MDTSSHTAPHAPTGRAAILARTPSRLRAIAQRDPRADGRFVYAVRTTGIYCRPSCPARRPAVANVALYAQPADAERAGFRACKRCRPQAHGLVDPIIDAITAACRTLDTVHPAPALAELAARAGYSPAHFHRAFRGVTGMTPKGYARAATARSAQATRMAEPLHYALGASPLGRVLVAAGAGGIRSIALGDSDAALLAELHQRFPKATLTPDAVRLKPSMQRVLDFIAMPAAGLALPLDVRGTAFQLRVWTALQRIPAGQTVSYAALAATLDAPTATRAVAGACAANPLALAVPCHRVVARDGTLAGYRWGLERKRALLAREAAAPMPVKTRARRPR